MCISHYDYVASPERKCHDTLPVVAGRQRERGISRVLANGNAGLPWGYLSLLGMQLHAFMGVDTGGRKFTLVFAQLWALSSSEIHHRAFSFILHSHLWCVVSACAVCVVCMAPCLFLRMGIIMDRIIFKPFCSPQSRYSSPELSPHCSSCPCGSLLYDGLCG